MEVITHPGSPFRLHQSFAPAGDQPQAIDKLVEGLNDGLSYQTLLGVTGSGKTYTMAHVIARIGRPALIIAPNKTLAAQLYSEMREFFPENAVEYFVSYYDYYQPEAYVPSRDLYIEKDSSINEHIEQMRLSATKSILERPDAIIVATVSCIYGIGDPSDYQEMRQVLREKDPVPQRDLLARLAGMQYTRNDIDFRRGTFRVRGDTIDVFPAESGEQALRISLYDDVIESLTLFDPLTGELLHKIPRFTLYAKSHYVTPRATVLRAIEGDQGRAARAPRLLPVAGKAPRAAAPPAAHAIRPRDDERARVLQGDRELLAPPVGRAPGEPPPTLIDYLPQGSLIVIDESHVTVPQIGGMFNGDRSRKTVLVDYGFRLPSALDNRPLKFEEFEGLVRQAIFVSATPAEYERAHASQVVEQVVRPDRPRRSGRDPAPGLVAGGRPCCRSWQAREIERARAGDDAHQAHGRGPDRLPLGARREGPLPCTRTSTRSSGSRSSATCARAFSTCWSASILLREGTGPSGGLAGRHSRRRTRKGFLRSARSLIQTIGRAARHINGTAILYADTMTDSMKAAIGETERRRAKQVAFNLAHGIEPKGISKRIKDMIEGAYDADEARETRKAAQERRATTRSPRSSSTRRSASSRRKCSRRRGTWSSSGPRACATS
jgi:excinuclease ABC subunit B